MEMEPVMETINELAESTPITSLVTSPNKMKTEINRASEGPVIGHSLHDVRSVVQPLFSRLCCCMFLWQIPRGLHTKSPIQLESCDQTEGKIHLRN